MKKNNELYYSLSFVIVLLLLLFGDQIILSAIPKSPNNNGTINKLEIKDNFAAISINEIWNKISSSETFILLFIREDCYRCVEVENYINQLGNLPASVYYLKIPVLNKEDMEYQKLINYDLRIKENESETPLLVKIKDGVVLDVMVGNGKNEYLKEFLTQI